MAYHLFVAKSLSEPMLTWCQSNPREYVSMKFYFKFKYFHSRKCVWKCCLPKWQPFCPGGDECLQGVGQVIYTPAMMPIQEGFYVDNNLVYDSRHPWHEDFRTSKLKSSEHSYCFNFLSFTRLHLCVCHNSCEKLWPDFIIIFHVREHIVFTRFQWWTRKSFMKESQLQLTAWQWGQLM